MAVKIISASREDEALKAASLAIIGEGIVAVPTETFYGLCTRFDSVPALEKLYAMKGRPKDMAIPLIIGDEDMLGLVTSAVTAAAKVLVRQFWPGPLTMLLDAREDLPELITAGTGKVAVRVPGASFALALVRSLGVPLTATSANISGLPPAGSAEEAVDYFDDSLDVVIDGGKTPGGAPSTIVEITDGQLKVRRPGRIKEEEIMAVLRG